MANGITVAKFRDVANGLQKGQFAIGDRVKIKGLSDLDPIYKALLDRPITVTLGLIGPDARIVMEPVKTPNGPVWRPRVMGAGEIGG